MVRPQWEFALSLDRGDASPLYLQITPTIAEEIVRGRLRPGDVLPGTRTLAALLHVNRVTVLTAYDELAAEGWITVHPARGCVVARQLSAGGRIRRAPDPAVTPPYQLAPTPVVQRSPEHLRGVLVFGASSPDRGCWTSSRSPAPTGGRSRKGADGCWATPIRKGIHGFGMRSRRCCAPRAGCR